MLFYDIAMRAPYAPNPWKSRLALNFKDVAYSTTWVPLPDIAQVRRTVDVPACRKFGDGTDFYTLPILIDPKTNSKIGDSFDIAIYLQKTYPAAGAGDLFPVQKLDFVFSPSYALLVPLSERKDTEYGDYSHFNTHVDAAFTAHVALTLDNLPFHPDTAEASKAEFVRRAGLTSWDDFKLKEEQRDKLKESFRLALGDLGKLFLRDTSGPFLLGKQASYADMVVGGWLHMMSASLPANEWEELRAWHGGIYGRLYDGLKKYAEVK
jgi:glutathione S-transferase